MSALAALVPIGSERDDRLDFSEGVKPLCVGSGIVAACKNESFYRSVLKGAQKGERAFVVDRIGFENQLAARSIRILIGDAQKFVALAVGRSDHGVGVDLEHLLREFDECGRTFGCQLCREGKAERTVAITDIAAETLGEN